MAAGIFLLVLLVGFQAVVHGFFTDTTMNTECQIPMAYNVTPFFNYDHRSIVLMVDHPMLVEKMHIVTDHGGCHEKNLESSPFIVDYVDHTDKTRQMRNVIKGKIGRWINSGTTLEVEFELPLYTNHLKLTSIMPITCASIQVVGCETSHMCQGHPELCGDGTCIGAGRCVCPEGAIGESCETSITNLTVDSFEPIALIGNLLYTKAAIFDVIGDVELISEGGRKRHYHSGGTHYGGYGGCTSYSNNHNGGYSSHGSYHNYPSSHNQHSAFGSPHSGYSMSSDCSFGHHHHHEHHHYFYTTHGDDHYSCGSSMYYHNHELHMHVHEEHHNHDHTSTHHHHHSSFPFYPDPDQTYNFAGSYSPQYGCSMMVNGYPVGSQTSSVSQKPSTQNTQQQPLCMGQCSLLNQQGNNKPSTTTTTVSSATHPAQVQVSPKTANVTQGTLTVTQLDAIALAKNSLLGILGPQLLNLMFASSQSTPAWLSAAMHPPTTTQTPSTTTSTQAPVTATSSTYAPVTATSSTYAPVTATSSTYAPVTASMNPYGTNTTHDPNVGPLCYSCPKHVPNDRQCNQLVQCYKNEICAAFQDQNGFVHRCMDKQVCLDSQQVTSHQCWYCCDQDHCNVECQASGGVVAHIQTTTVPTTTTAKCEDTSQCGALKNVGYNVCADQTVVDTMCQKTCKAC